MSLEDAIKRFENQSKSGSDVERSDALQIANWLQELKERREKDIRNGTDFES